MEKKLVKLSVVGHRNKKEGLYLEIKPNQKKVPYPFNINEHFKIPVMIESDFYAGPDWFREGERSFSLDYSNAFTASGTPLLEIMNINQTVRDAFYSIEQVLLWAVKLSLEDNRTKGYKILVDFPIGGSLESTSEYRLGKPPTYCYRKTVRRIKAIPVN